MSRALLPSQSYFHKQIHVSWFIAWFSLGILVGVGLAGVFGGIIIHSLWLIIVAVLAVAALAKRRIWALAIVCVAGCVIGLWRGSIEQVELGEYRQYYDTYVSVAGRVSEDTTFDESGRQRIRLADVAINEQQMTGTVWLSANFSEEVRRGDLLVIEGMLVEGFGTVPATVRSPNIKQVNRPVPGDVARQLRDWFGEGVNRAIPHPEAGLGMAYLVGQKNTVPEDITDQFRTIGLVHAIVASGFHLTVLVMIIRRIAERRSKYLTMLGAGSVIVSFIAITGLSPSMTRAGLIAGLSLLAWYYGRVIHPLVLLSFGAAVTVMWNPTYLWGDVGWYLSFIAFAGVIILAPLLHAYFWNMNKRPSILLATVVTTIAAQIVTLPLTIFVFGYYSIYAVLANILVVPLVPVAMLLTFIAGMVGLVAPGIAGVAGWPAYMLMNYMLQVSERVANLPNAKTELIINVWVVLVAYVVIIGIALILWRVTKYNFRKQSDLL